MKRLLNDIDLAWAAGFYDGEGCCSIKITKYFGLKGKKEYPALTLSISQRNNRFPLLRFQESVGLGTVNGPDYNFTTYWRTHTFEESQAVMAMIWKFLCPAKRKQYITKVKEYAEKTA